jgi:hypothetical protein
MPYPLKVEVGKKNHPAKQTPPICKGSRKDNAFVNLDSNLEILPIFHQRDKKKGLIKSGDLKKKKKSLWGIERFDRISVAITVG